VAEHFLGACVGGRAEPIGQAFANTRALTVADAGIIAGLEEVAPAAPTPRPQPVVAVRTPAPAVEQPAVAPVRRPERSGPPG